MHHWTAVNSWDIVVHSLKSDSMSGENFSDCESFFFKNNGEAIMVTAEWYVSILKNFFCSSAGNRMCLCHPHSSIHYGHHLIKRKITISQIRIIPWLQGLVIESPTYNCLTYMISQSLFFFIAIASVIDE